MSHVHFLGHGSECGVCAGLLSGWCLCLPGCLRTSCYSCLSVGHWCFTAFMSVFIFLLMCRERGNYKVTNSLRARAGVDCIGWMGFEKAL